MSGVETRGVEMVPEAERTARPRDIFWIGIGGNLAFSIVLFGWLGAGGAAARHA